MMKIGICLVIAVFIFGSIEVESSTKLGYAWDGKGNSSAWNPDGNHIGWYYNWAETPNAAGNKEFVTMMWGSAHVSSWLSAYTSGKLNYCGEFLGFNEPDNGGQANLSPSAAAILWKTNILPIPRTRFRWGAPAVTSNQATGLPWLHQFFGNCTGCVFDFLPIHWYGSDVNAFTTYVQLLHTTFNLNIWITEFSCVDFTGSNPCTQTLVNNFMNTASIFLDGASYVEKYAWFGCSGVSGIPTTDNLLASGLNTLSPLGQQYVNRGGRS